MIEEYLGLDSFMDVSDTLRLVFRLCLTLAFTAWVICGSYSKRYRSTDHVFTYWLFSIVTFSIAFLLRKVPMELGFALGLFAVFGVLRYRTESIAIKDLTYLFVVIGISLVNSLANKKISLVELLVVNTAIAGASYFLEGTWRKRESSLRLTYDQVNRLAPQNRDALIRELSERLEMPLTHVVVHSVDLLRDTADISVFFNDGAEQSPKE